MAEEPAAPMHLLDVPSELLACILRQVAPATPPLTIHNANATNMFDLSPNLCTRHPAAAIVDAKLLEAKVRSVCTQFRFALPPPNPLMQATLINAVYQQRNLPRRDNPHVLRAGTNVWLPEEVVLDDEKPTIFAYEVRADNSQSECIGAFSHSCVRWVGGGAGEDALTWYAAPHRHDFTFRTRMFDFFPPLAVVQAYRVRLSHSKWVLVTVELTTKRAAYWVGGQLIAEADLTREGTRRATPGWFGMVTYASPYSWRNAVILRPT